jgi:hypothetical protein
MARKSKRTTSKSNVTVKKHTEALLEHSSALRNHVAALAATKPQKTLQQKIADVGACMSQWLMKAKGVSKADSTTATKNMAADFRMSGPEEMQRCLEWVQGCLSGKGDIYNLDTTSPNANQHLNTLVTGTLGAVVSDIANNTT